MTTNNTLPAPGSAFRTSLKPCTRCGVYTRTQRVRRFGSGVYHLCADCRRALSGAVAEPFRAEKCNADGCGGLDVSAVMEALLAAERPLRFRELMRAVARRYDALEAGQLRLALRVLAARRAVVTIAWRGRRAIIAAGA